MGNLPAVIFADIAAVAAVSAIPAYIIRSRKIENKKLKLTLYLLTLNFLIRLIVELVDETGFITDMNIVEKIVNSLVLSFSALGFTTDYTGFVVAGKAWFQSFGLNLGAHVYGIVVAYLSITAPVCTGALLLEILTSVLPGLKVRLHMRCHKFVFSSLNEKSVTLAEDLCRDGNYKSCFPGRIHGRPMFIFANAGSVSPVSAAGLSGRAADIGAVCVRSDVTELKLRRSRTVSYLLTDDDASKNISTASRLLTPDNKGRFLWPSSAFPGKTDSGEEPAAGIYVLSEDTQDTSMLRRICAQKAEGSERALVRAVCSDKNTAYNLMNDVPLFLPLLYNASPARADERMDSEKELCVTVIGDGTLASEIFRAVFWCGQMLNTVLKINILSADADRMKNQLAEECPELPESCTEGSRILRTHPDSPDMTNPPYALTDFISVGDLSLISEYPAGVIDKTDYFIIAADSDEIDLRLAEKLNVRLSKKCLSEGAKMTVIAAAVSSPELSGTVHAAKACPGPFVVTFGDLVSRYSCRNVFMNEFTADALSSANRYNRASQRKAASDEYAYWSNMAKVIHAPYKAYSLGLVNASPDSPRGYEVCTGRVLTEYERDEYAWLEHRRWNAFLRTQGFTLVSGAEYDRLYSAAHSHKSVDLRLHNCLVESRVTPKPLPSPDSILSDSFDRDGYDCLDFVTMDAWKKNRAASAERQDSLEHVDYKLWDYPEFDKAFLNLSGDS